MTAEQHDLFRELIAEGIAAYLDTESEAIYQEMADPQETVLGKLSPERDYVVKWAPGMRGCYVRVGDHACVVAISYSGPGSDTEAGIVDTSTR